MIMLRVGYIEMDSGCRYRDCARTSQVRTVCDGHDWHDGHDGHEGLNPADLFSSTCR